VLVVLAVAAALAAGGDVHVIHGDRSAGGIRIGRSTVPDVQKLFGVPSTSRKLSAQSCVRSWKRLYLVVHFFSFEGKPCEQGGAITVTVTGRAAWRTALGLRVGDTVARLRSLYPRTRLRGQGFDRGYWLLTRQNCAEVGGGAYPGLLARVRNGRVSALVAGISICD
jgi:hypothetical protein